MKLMKRFFFLFLLFPAFNSYGQNFIPYDQNLTVFLDIPLGPFCQGGKFTFVTKVTDTVIDPLSYIYNYKWFFNNVEIPDSTRKYLVVRNITASDTGFYKCVVSDSTRSATSNSIDLQMRGELHVDTLYRYNALGCPTDSNGQMKILVSGGHLPYTYVWSGGSFHQLDTLGVGFPKGTYTITVTDSDTTHCVTREFTIDVLKLHKITFHMTPPDTVYLSNPEITVTIPDTAVKHLENWNWDFDDKTPKIPNVNPCQHNYAKAFEYHVQLNFTDNVGGQLCDSTIIDTMTVKTIHLFVHNVITPGTGDDNGSLNIREINPSDGKPRGSNLDLSEIFLSNQLIIFNRQGMKVYDKTNYASGEWNGGNLSAGVYYYILRCHGENGDDVYRGAITIIRN